MLKLESIAPWAAHPQAAPVTRRAEDGALKIAANGTRLCAGGWRLVYSGAKPGETYLISCEARHAALGGMAREALTCLARWTAIDGGDARSFPRHVWDCLPSQPAGPRALRFSRVLTAPEMPADAAAGAAAAAGANGHLTVEYGFRWASKGNSTWRLPEITRAPAANHTARNGKRAVTIALVTGRANSRHGVEWTLARNIEFYSRLCEAACDKTRPDLIVLPEIALQWNCKGGAIALAVPAPGPETDVFARIARRHKTRILLGLNERDGDAVHNTAALISPQGAIEGKYRKVHLALAGESWSGVLPGDSFPVFDTELGRIGCNICMDSSYTESSRAIGLAGAEFLLMPIMGDHRASRWAMGSPGFDEERWRAIMRVHAMDNQLCMAVARNNGEGSCIVDRSGEFLAYNDGRQDFVAATVKRDDGYRTWNGSCFRDDVWAYRRPRAYGAFVDAGNWGSLPAMA